MDFLKEIVGEELYGQISEKVGEYNKTHTPVKIVDLSTGDYVSKSKLDRERATLEDALNKQTTDQSAAQKTIEDLQKMVDEYKAAEKQKEIDEAIRKRFDSAKGKDREFINDYTAQGIADKFKSAVLDESNVGKSDADIFNAIVSNQQGLFVNQHQPENIPPMKSDNKDVVASDFFARPLSEQMQFANDHPDLYKKIINKES